MSIEARLLAIESALEKLNAFAALQDELETARMQNETLDRADFLALRTIVAELAAEAVRRSRRVTPEDFEQHFGLRLRWWHERLILAAGDRDPSLAERLSVQFPGESEPSPDGFPSLFDPPTPPE
jgi:hypothetical protein